MDRYYGFVMISFVMISMISLFILCITFPKIESVKLCLKVFKEKDVFKDVLRFFHDKGPIYDKTLKP